MMVHLSLILFDPDRIKNHSGHCSLSHMWRGNETFFCVTKPTGFSITSHFVHLIMCAISSATLTQFAFCFDKDQKTIKSG